MPSSVLTQCLKTIQFLEKSHHACGRRDRGRPIGLFTRLHHLHGMHPILRHEAVTADANVCREGEPAFYSLLLHHAEEILPFVYTPTVGEACQRYHRLPLTPVGLHLRATDPSFLTALRAWPHQDVRCAARGRPLAAMPLLVRARHSMRFPVSQLWPRNRLLPVPQADHHALIIQY